MADIKDNKQINPFATGVAGAVIGAGIGAAATKVLSDKKTREKILHTISNTKGRIAEYVKTARNEIKKKGESAEAMMKEGEKATREATATRSR